MIFLCSYLSHGTCGTNVFQVCCNIRITEHNLRDPRVICRERVKRSIHVDSPKNVLRVYDEYVYINTRICVFGSNKLIHSGSGLTLWVWVVQWCFLFVRCVRESFDKCQHTHTHTQQSSTNRASFWPSVVECSDLSRTIEDIHLYGFDLAKQNFLVVF